LGFGWRFNPASREALHGNFAIVNGFTKTNSPADQQRAGQLSHNQGEAASLQTIGHPTGHITGAFDEDQDVFEDGINVHAVTVNKVGSLICQVDGFSNYSLYPSEKTSIIK
jgi:hypothetical protein